MTQVEYQQFDQRAVVADGVDDGFHARAVVDEHALDDTAGALEETANFHQANLVGGEDERLRSIGFAAGVLVPGRGELERQTQFEA